MTVGRTVGAVAVSIMAGICMEVQLLLELLNGLYN